LRTKLREKISKMEKHLEHFPSDAVHLQVNLDRHARKEWFTVALTLRLPSNVLHAEKQGADPVPAFDQAIKALLREIAVLKSALRREAQYDRAPRRQAARLAAPVGFAEAGAF
jgi:ribosomal subunit interface protein